MGIPVITIPGLFSKMPGVLDPTFLVIPLKDFEKQQIAPWGKQVQAPNARMAILKARAEVLDKWLRDHPTRVEGWYVAEWSDERNGWNDPQFFPKDMK